MPAKRRVGKDRRLDPYSEEMLRDGPQEMLLAGVGYLAGRSGAVFATCNPADQQAIVDLMRSDWWRHGAVLAARWRDLGELAVGQLSWAEREFGSPGATARTKLSG